MLHCCDILSGVNTKHSHRRRPSLRPCPLHTSWQWSAPGTWPHTRPEAWWKSAAAGGFLDWAGGLQGQTEYGGESGIGPKSVWNGRFQIILSTFLINLYLLMSDHCASFLVPSVKRMSFPSQQERTTFLDVPPASDPALRWRTKGVGAARQSRWANLPRETDLFLQLHKGNVVLEATAPAAIT